MPRFTVSFFLIGISALSSHAAVIRGTVTEQRTGYVLSRTAVTLEPVPSAGQQVRTARTGQNGQFVFGNVTAGSYLLKASHRGFLPVQYGQKRWDAAGAVIIVIGDEVITVDLPMHRYGAIAGTVRDSNEVGIPDQDVAAYTSSQPPVFVTRGESDDRGVFRIGGLEPGTYLVRTTGGNDDERSYLPSFSRQTLRVEEARPILVYPDEDTLDGDVRPIEGRLFMLTGSAPLPLPGSFFVTVTLASDLGRAYSNGPAFRFPALAPGHYELYAEARENPPGTRVLGGYTDLLIERNISNFALPMNEIRETRFVLDGAGLGSTASALVRRKDYAGTGEVQNVVLNATTGISLLPGHWEVQIVAPRGYYVSHFGGPRNAVSRPDGWNDVLIGSSGFVSATLSNGPAALHGVVRDSAKPIPGAPVFLEGWDPVTRNRLIDPRETRSDARGNYRFDNLAPGDYRILSTFDYAAPNPQIFDASRANEIRLEKATDPAVDLELSGNP
ncbi:MAG TPA: carboxypeptidase-like regulatory domain-containing protein [Bryobacteraceae bacterium]|jgi:hypothetical protein|nr:carboxypeptidase-like regulatory domain-containing protein [Bryobacteraceae bacterium]